VRANNANIASHAINVNDANKNNINNFTNLYHILLQRMHAKVHIIFARMVWKEVKKEVM